MTFISSHSRTSERGVALPAALLLLLVIATSTAILSRGATDHLELSKIQEVSQSLFLVTEGAIQDQVRKMVLQPEAWKQVAPLADRPSSYSAFQPANYAAQNGIPTCAGDGCLRRMHPVGGGLLKNLGPITSAGKSVDSTQDVDKQFDPEDLPGESDTTLAEIDAYTQIERLDRVVTPADATGANLSTSGNILGNSESVRFRITGHATKKLKGREGTSVLVAVIEMPAV